MAFEPNQGQAEAGVDFLSRGSGYSLYLKPSEVTLFLSRPAVPREPTKTTRGDFPAEAARPAVLRLRFLRSNPAAGKALGKLPGEVNDYSGNDPRHWHTDIPIYGRVEYAEIYRGVKVAYHGSWRELEYEFIIAPGADPKAIRIAFEGADKVQRDAQGDLLLRVQGGEIRQLKPVAYQQIDGAWKAVEVSYRLYGRNQVGFQLGAYDDSRELVIDPVLSYSTFLGFSYADVGNAVAVDSAGNAYVAGRTNTAWSANDALVAKFNPAGGLVYQNFFRGAGTGDGFDVASGIAVDASGKAYVVGTTVSRNFPTTPNAFDSTCGFVGPCNRADAFIMKLDTGGQPEYSTYFGGDYTEKGNAIAVDSLGRAYVTGRAESLPIKGGFQPVGGGGSCPTDAYVAKFDFSQAGPNSLVYSSFLGSAGNDEGVGIAVRGESAYVTGVTGRAFAPGTPIGTFSCIAGLGTKFPTTANAFEADSGLGAKAFLTVVNPAGNALDYSTVVPGTNEGAGIAVDSTGSAFITGSTSGGLPVKNAFQSTYSLGDDAFVAKFDPAQSGAASLVYASFLGGSSEDIGNGIAVDSSGRAYVTGMTRSTNFPITASNALQQTKGAGLCGTANYFCPDVFVTRVNSSGNALEFSTYLGGSGQNSYDEGHGIALRLGNIPGNIYVTGETFSSNFPTTAGALAGNYDIFVARITLGSDLRITKTATPTPAHAGHDVTYRITVTNDGPDDAPDAHFEDTLPGALGSTATFTVVSATTNRGSCYPLSAQVHACDFGPLAKGASATVTIVLRPTSAGFLRNGASVSSSVDDPEPANSKAEIQTTVEAWADLGVFIYDIPDPIGLGTNLSYCINTINHGGPDLAAGVQMQVTLPAGFTYVSHRPSYVNCPSPSTPPGQIPCTSISPQIVRCEIGTLPSGWSQMLELVVAPSPAGTFVTTAAVRGNITADSNPANNKMDIDTTVVLGRPKLEAGIENVQRLSPTEVLVVVQFRNIGRGIAQNITLNQVQFQVLSGSGVLSLASPTLPFALANLGVNARTGNIKFIVNARTTVIQFLMTESGTMQDFAGNTHTFSTSQVARIP